MSAYAGRFGPETVFNGEVALLPGRLVRVDGAGTTTLATLYTDRTKTVEASNPVAIDALGNLSFFADPGDYDVKLITNGVIGVAVGARVFEDPSEDVTDVTDLQAQIVAEAALARNADNLTSGTVADARVASTIARDTEVTAAVAAEATARANAVTTEATTRASADSTLTAGLAQEVVDRVSGDAAAVHLVGTETITGTKNFALARFSTSPWIDPTHPTFGAVGDNVSDDTTALQAWVAGVCTASGGRGYVPKPSVGYKITAPLIIPASARWKIEAASRGVRIIQHTDNTPIFVFDSDLTHSWTISGIQYEWANNQPAANTLAIGIYFRFNGLTSASSFGWKIDDAQFINGYRSVAVRQSGTGQIGVWGFVMDRINHGGSMTGAMFYSLSPSAVGEPQHKFSHCEINAANASEPLITDTYAAQVTLDDVEVLNGDYSTFSVFEFGSCGQVIFNNVKHEVATIAAGSRLWHFVQCEAITLIGSALQAISGGDVSANAPRLIANDTGGVLNIIGLSVGVTTSAGNAIAYLATQIGLVTGVALTGNVTQYARDLLGNVPVPKFLLDAATQNTIVNRGDNTVTMDVANTVDNYRVQRFSTTLTANRTITLPSTGVIRDMEYEIVRDASTPGAFTLTIIDPLSSKNTVIAANAKGFARYRAASSGEWMLVAKGELADGSTFAHLAGTETFTGDKTFTGTLTTATTTVGALTATSIAGTGTVALTDTLTVTDAKNVVVGTTTGTKIGTATTQKLGFFNATPVVQEAGSNDVLASLVTLGLRAASSNPPLNLGSGTLTAGAGTFTGTVQSSGGSMVAGGSPPANIRAAFFAGNAGVVALRASGFTTQTADLFQCSDVSLNVLLRVQAGGHLQFSDAINLVAGTTTGTKIGTATSQKLGFWNATPVVQQARPTDAASIITLLTTLGLCA